MEQFLEKVAEINDVVNSFAWGWFAIGLLLGTGLICTVITKFFQFSHIKHWWSKTIATVFAKETHNKNEEGAVSQFQALCTALAATIGTGNIAGVAAAICVGGPGAVFWMWVAALLGMMTNFSENVLGIYFRRKNAENEWSGGPMYYLRDGLGSYKGCKQIGKILAVIFACFAILASFGIGNLGQINKITLNIESAFFSGINAPTLGGVSIVNWIIGFTLMIVGGFIIFGGLKRIAAVAERVVPFMALVYVVGALIIMLSHITTIGAMFAAIFKFAFGAKALAGGATGTALSLAIKNGCKRGIFSNEAGLGSAPIAAAAAKIESPGKQGLISMTGTVIDTLIICTATALMCLSTGVPHTKEVSGAAYVQNAVQSALGDFGPIFIAVAMCLFAFTTLIGNYSYCEGCIKFILNAEPSKSLLMGFRIFASILVFVGAAANAGLVWDLADMCQGLMVVTNVPAILLLGGVAAKCMDDYSKQKAEGKNPHYVAKDAGLEEDTDFWK